MAQLVAVNNTHINIAEILDSSKPEPKDYDRVYSVLAEAFVAKKRVSESSIKGLITLVQRDFPTDNDDLKESILRVLLLCSQNNAIIYSLSRIDIVELILNIVLSDYKVKRKSLWLTAVETFSNTKATHLVKTLVEKNKLDVCGAFLRMFNPEDVELSIQLKVLDNALSLLKICQESDGLKLYYNLFFPLLFASYDAINQELRWKAADMIAYKSLYPIAKLSPEQKTKFLNILKSNYLPFIKTLLDMGNMNWKRLWIFIVNMLGTELHGNFEIINLILNVTENAFRKDILETKIAGYDCWMALIDNYALNPKYMCSPKHMKLILKPLIANLSKSNELTLKRLKVWHHLMKILGASGIEYYLEPVLNFCFGPLGDEPLLTHAHGAVASVGKRTATLWKPATQLLVQMLGHSGQYCDKSETAKQKNACLRDDAWYFAIDSTKNETFFRKHAVRIVNAVGECSLLTMQWANVTLGANVLACLWKGLLAHANALKDAQDKKAFNDAVCALVDVMFDLQEKNPQVFYLCLVPIILVLKSPELFDESTFDALLLRNLAKMRQIEMSNITKPFIITQKEEKHIKAECCIELNSAVYQFFFKLTDDIKDPDRLEKYYPYWLSLCDLIVEKSESAEVIVQFLKWPLTNFVKNMPEETAERYANVLKHVCSPKVPIVDVLTKLKKAVERKPKTVMFVLKILDGVLEHKILQDGSDRKKFLSCACSVFDKYDSSEKNDTLKTFALDTIRYFMGYNSNEPEMGSMIYSYLILNAEHLEFLDLAIKFYEKVSTTNPPAYIPSAVVNRFTELNESTDWHASTSSKNKLKRLLSVLKPYPTRPKNGTAKATSEMASGRGARIVGLLRDMAEKPAEEKPTIILGHDLSTMTPVHLKGSMLNNPSPMSKPVTPANKSPSSKPAARSHAAAINDIPENKYVVIDTEYKFSKKNLSEHQKEVLKRRRDDIPALYCDLTQSMSQDMFSPFASSEDSSSQSQNPFKVAAAAAAEPAESVTDTRKRAPAQFDIANVSNKKQKLQDVEAADAAVIEIDCEEIPEETEPKSDLAERQDHESSSSPDQLTQIPNECARSTEETAPKQNTASATKRCVGRPKKSDSLSPKPVVVQNVSKAVPLDDEQKRQQDEELKRKKIEKEMRKIHIDAVIGDEILKNLNVPKTEIGGRSLRRVSRKSLNKRASASEESLYLTPAKSKKLRKSIAAKAAATEVDETSTVVVQQQPEEDSQSLVESSQESLVSIKPASPLKTPSTLKIAAAAAASIDASSPKQMDVDELTEILRKSPSISPDYKLLKSSRVVLSKMESPIKKKLLFDAGADADDAVEVEVEDESKPSDVQQESVEVEEKEQEVGNADAQMEISDDDSNQDILSDIPVTADVDEEPVVVVENVTDEPETDEIMVKTPLVFIPEISLQTISQAIKVADPEIMVPLAETELTDSEKAYCAMETETVEMEDPTPEPRPEHQNEPTLQEVDPLPVEQIEVDATATETEKVEEEICASPPLGQLLSTLQDESIPCSPITVETPERKKQLLDSTLDMSPIRLEESLAAADENESSSCSSLDDAKDTLINAELLQIAPPKDINLENVRFITPQSNSRSEMLLNLALDKNADSPSRRISILKSEPLATKTLGANSPTSTSAMKHSPHTKSRFWKILESYDEGIKKDRKEKEESEVENLEVLSFSKAVPSPLATPEASILKRKQPDSLEEGVSPLAKRKRVNFSDPLTTSTKIFFTEKRLSASKLAKKIKIKMDSITPVKLFEKTKSLELETCNEENDQNGQNFIRMVEENDGAATNEEIAVKLAEPTETQADEMQVDVQPDTDDDATHTTDSVNVTENLLLASETVVVEQPPLAAERAEEDVSKKVVVPDDNIRLDDHLSIKIPPEAAAPSVETISSPRMENITIKLVKKTSPLISPSTSRKHKTDSEAKQEYVIVQNSVSDELKCSASGSTASNSADVVLNLWPEASIIKDNMKEAIHRAETQNLNMELFFHYVRNLCNEKVSGNPHKVACEPPSLENTSTGTKSEVVAYMQKLKASDYEEYKKLCYRLIFDL